MNEEFAPTERELWNTAKIYSISHVAEPLVRCRKYITICLFGVEEIGQEYGIDESVKNQNKVCAIERLLQELKQLILDNINFMKKKDKAELDKILTNLEDVETVIDGCSYISKDERSKIEKTELNTEHFNLCLKTLRKANSDIKKYLGDLIFPSGDDLDLEKIKNDLIENG